MFVAAPRDERFYLMLVIVFVTLFDLVLTKVVPPTFVTCELLIRSGRILRFRPSYEQSLLIRILEQRRTTLTKNGSSPESRLERRVCSIARA